MGTPYIGVHNIHDILRDIDNRVHDIDNNILLSSRSSIRVASLRRIESLHNILANIDLPHKCLPTAVDDA